MSWFMNILEYLIWQVIINDLPALKTKILNAIITTQ
jgi:uncharacterized protein with HEPN domain